MPTIDITEAQYKRLCSRFAYRIRQSRHALAMKQPQFASHVGVVAGNTISRWEGAHNLPRAKRLIVVAERLRVSLDWLMGLVDDAEVEADMEARTAERNLPTIRERILKLLGSRSKHWHIQEIIRAVQENDRPDSVESTLGRMVRDKEIKRVRYGVYCAKP